MAHPSMSFFPPSGLYFRHHIHASFLHRSFRSGQKLASGIIPSFENLLSYIVSSHEGIEHE